MCITKQATVAKISNASCTPITTATKRNACRFTYLELGSFYILMKAFLLAAAMMTAPMSAMAVEIDPQSGTSRESYGYRQCRNAGGEWGRYVCYNTTRTSWISIAGILPVPITRTKYRTHRVDCSRRHFGDSLHSQVAAAYCPRLPGLAPAPFLSLTD